MKNQYIEDELFENRIFTAEELANTTFEACRFINCDYSEKKLIATRFIDCSFSDCNFTMAVLNEVQLANARFSDCKLLGVNFGRCSTFLFEVGFNKCVLDYASFEKLKMAKTPFVDCNLKGCDFAGTDLNLSTIIRSNLTEAIFDGTNLKGADLSTAYAYTIDPDRNLIKGAKFSLNGIGGLLDKYGIIIE